MTTSPPKEHNFDAIPTVHALDEFFHRKYEDVGEGEQHELRQVATAEEILAEQEAHADQHIHMPSPSYWPIVLAFALPIIGLRHHLQPRLIAVVGVAIVLLGMLRLGARAVGRRRTPTTTRRPTTAASELATVAGAPMADIAVDPRRPRRSSATRRGRRPRCHGAPRRARHHRAVATTSWRCGCSSARVPAVRRPDLHLHALPRPPLRRARPRPGLRHPVHLGVELRAADELADDGARRVRRPARATTATPGCGSSSPRCSGPRSSAARSTSSRRSTTRASASPPACSRRASTRSPASTAST